MGLFVTQGAILQCSFGMAPSSLYVPPGKMVLCSSLPMASIMDNQVLPFGMCNSLANPTVAAATAAALGVLTPMPCMPVIVGPWITGHQTVLLGGAPALTQDAIIMCAYGGVISICSSAQSTIHYSSQ